MVKVGYESWLLVDRDPKKSPEIACSSRTRNAISRSYFCSVPSSIKINSVWLGSIDASPFCPRRGFVYCTFVPWTSSCWKPDTQPQEAIPYC